MITPLLLNKVIKVLIIFKKIIQTKFIQYRAKRTKNELPIPQSANNNDPATILASIVLKVRHIDRRIKKVPDRVNAGIIEQNLRKVTISITVSTVKQLQTQKAKLDKLIDLFVGKNMTQAKKMINKKSSQAQKIIETSLEREIEKANQRLKQFTDKLLEPYLTMESLTELAQLHLEFDEDFMGIQESIESRKRQLKRQIIQKMKEEMRNFYLQSFDF